MSIASYEKDLCSLLRKLGLGIVHGVNISVEKSKPLASWFEKIWKVECLVNYSASLSTSRGKRSNARM